MLSQGLLSVSLKRFTAVCAFLLLPGVSDSVSLSNSASAAGFEYPLAIVAAGEATTYVADRNVPGIWKVVDGKASIFFRGSKKFRTPLNAVRCLALDAEGKLLAGDSATRDIYRFDEAGQPVPLTKGGVGIPMAIVADSNGTLFVADLESHRIFKVPAAGGEATVFAEIPAPRGLTIDAQDRLWVVSHGKNHVVRILPDGTIETVVKGRPFEFPHNIVLDKDQNAFVSDGYAKTVWKVDSAGQVQKWVTGEPLINPVGIAWRGEKLLVVDPHAKAIFSADNAGILEQLPLAFPEP